MTHKLRNVLGRAAREMPFVPWAYVLADAVTTAACCGYRLAQDAAAATDGPGRQFIDELGRASRDAIEALRLGKRIEAAGKRLVGVSDGFDSDSAQFARRAET